MLEYIYFVKCPNCEDEHFYFFNDAKDFAMGCLSQKPIITQVEVNRNDFGECTDSCDLGTIWSWEDLMTDVPAKPEPMAFNKADTLYCDDNFFNQEFDDLDNPMDFVSDGFRKSSTRITEADGREDPVEERRKAQTQRGYDPNKAPSSSSTSARDNDLENRASRTQLGYNPHQAPSKAETSARDNDLENRDAIAPDQKTISKVLVKYATLMPYDMYDKLEGKAAQVLKASKPWWLKSPGDEAGYAMCVMENGGMTEKSVASKQGLRPVIEVIPADFADDELYQPVKAMNGDWIKISDKYLLLKDPTEMVAFDALNTLRNDFDRANIKNALDAWCEKYFKSVGAVFGSNSAEYTREVSKQLDKDAKREAFNIRKPVPTDMTIESLVEEMEENEDTVECKVCEELFDKQSCIKDPEKGWVCENCSGSSSNVLAEASKPLNTVELHYDSLTVDIATKYIPATLEEPDDYEEGEYTDEFDFEVEVSDVEEALWNEFITEGDATEAPGGLAALEDESAWRAFIDLNFNILFEKYYEQLLEYFREDAEEAACDEFQQRYNDLMDEGPDPDRAYDEWRDSQRFDEELDLEVVEELEDSHTHLTMCPECGANSFDIETGICVACGFN